MQAAELFRLAAITGSDADFFAGREKELQQALETLLQPNQSCIIYGERGVGKTSFAWQIISILNRTNKRFASLLGQLQRPIPKFYCVPVKNLEAPKNVDELLVQAISPSRKENSLYKQIPELYEDSEFIDYVKRTYDVNLNSATDLDVFSKVPDNEDIVKRLFSEVLERIQEIHPKSNPVFFVDELEHMKDKTGLGMLVKNTNHAKFVLIGIADSVDELAGEHESSLRRLIGGIIELRGLPNKKIEQIFVTAERKSGKVIKFKSDFKRLAIKYCGGFPWIAQNLGVNSLKGVKIRALDSQMNRYVIDRERFEPAWKVVRETYKLAVGGKANYDNIKPSSEEGKIARALIDLEPYPSLEMIAQKSGFKNMVVCELAMRRLIESRIVFERDDQTYRFVDPIVRTFVIEILE